MFAGSILVVHALIGDEPKADLPHPAALILPIFAAFSVLLGMLGARLRRRVAPAAAAG